MPPYHSCMCLQSISDGMIVPLHYFVILFVVANLRWIEQSGL